MSLNHQNADQPTLPLGSTDDDYEIITSEEVDSVLDSLETLIASTASENIRSLLEEAADNIFSLVYSDEEHAASEAERDEAA